jgi:replicative DNA helicase
MLSSTSRRSFIIGMGCFAINLISHISGLNFEKYKKVGKKNRLITEFSTGYQRFGSLIGWPQKEDLFLLAGRPSMGKTTLALHLARIAAIYFQIPVAIFSLEMSKEQIYYRMLCMEKSRLFNADTPLLSSPIYIDDTPCISVSEIGTKARQLNNDNRLGLIIIDYLQLMPNFPKMENQSLKSTEFARSLKLLAIDIGVPVLALSQINKKIEERIDKRPQLSDLKGFGDLEQYADIVAFVYRDEVYHPEKRDNKSKVELIVSKNRNGSTGMIHLALDGCLNRTTDML